MSHTTASIPVDLKSPGQVLACMGFVEAAEVLLGGVEAHFDWSKAQTTFVLRASGDANPFEVVLEFLTKARIVELTPIGYVEGGAADGDDGEEPTHEEPMAGQEDNTEELDDDPGTSGRITSAGFPSGSYKRKELPARLVCDGQWLSVGHWADGSSRSTFKTFAGQQRGAGIAEDMRKRLAELFHAKREAVVGAPFDVTTAINGKFGFDPRCGWLPIDAGYSPDAQAHPLSASPIVELLAPIGLENSRLHGYKTRLVHYAAWGKPLPPILARAAVSGASFGVPSRRFEFELRLINKKYKIATFASERNQP